MAGRTPALSLIVPTRQRVGSLRNLLDSLHATALAPGALEVVLVVDADDGPTLAFRHAGLALTPVVIPPGRTMGTLNAEGYRASRGDFVMLLNDDVVAQTPGWDEKVLRRLRRFPDGIVLVHVNDTLLRDNLCTFPIVSRTFCKLAGGICPVEYVRYRIDDHIEDVFNLLGRLGHRRTIYLPDVVFEHGNRVVQPSGHAEYHSLPDLLAVDAPRFLTLFPDRKQLAVTLLAHIEGSLSPERLEHAHRILNAIADPFGLRMPDRLQVESDVPLARRLLRRFAGMTAQTYRRALRAVRRRLTGKEW